MTNNLNALYRKLLVILVEKQEEFGHFMTPKEYKEVCGLCFRIDTATAKEILKELHAEGLVDFDNEKVVIRKPKEVPHGPK